MSLDAAGALGSPPLRRAAALALLAACLGLILAGLVLPAIDHYLALDDSITASEAALQRYTTIAARLPRLEAEQATLTRALAAQDGFLKATSDALIAAEMQGRIKSVVERAGGEIRSTQILPAADEKGFRRISARVEVTGSAESLERTWYEMESGTPFLFIDSFDIAGRPMPNRDRTATPVIMLDAHFEVTAYARAAAP